MSPFRIVKTKRITSGGVNTRTGSFTMGRTDVQLRGPGIVFSRTYNSNDTRVGSLGPGWTHRYAMRLVDPGDGSDAVVLVGPEGRSDRYTRLPNGEYAPPPGVSTLLTRQADGTFRTTTRDQTVFDFDTDGRLTAIVDRFGVAIPLTYDETGRLVGIGDPERGATLALEYDAEIGRLVAVGLADDPVRTTFAYDDLGRLIAFTDRTGATTAYTYDGDSQRITTITDPRGIVVLTNTYDDQGRVISQTDAVGATTTYDYGRSRLPAGPLPKSLEQGQE